MTAALVPSNHRPIEHALAEILKPIGTLDPTAIEAMWDAWRCPSAYLPFLAYALSVDYWDDGWDEIRKRKVIEQSPAYHRRKGSRLAIEEALATLGTGYDLTEWWEVSPPRRRGTARVMIPISVPAAFALVPVARRRVYAAKPKSRAVQIGVGDAVSHTVFVAGAMHTRRALTIEPYRVPITNPFGTVFTGAAIHSRRTMILEGQTA